MSFKPSGYNSLSPYLMVEEGDNVIDFMKAAFDGTVTRRFDAEDGRIIHAEVKIDDTLVMLSEANEQNPAFPIWLHLYVPDVDATYAKALAAGAQSMVEPRQEDGDPDKRGGVIGPGGNTWFISSQIAD